MATIIETQHPALQQEWVVSHPTVELRPVQHTHETLTNWKKWLEDPDVHLWMTGDIPRSPDQVNQWLYHATHDPLRHYFSIYADGIMVGIVNLRQDQAPHETAEIGIVIGDPSLRSKGIGTHTIKQVEDLAQQDLGITNIRAHIHPENEKSLRLFTGQGYTYIGDVTIHGKPMHRFQKILI